MASAVPRCRESAKDLVVHRRWAFLSIQVREKKLEVRLTRQGSVVIPDAKLVTVQSAAEVMKVLDRGQRNRAAGQTDYNLHSSRSHCVLTVYVEGITLCIVQTHNRVLSRFQIILSRPLLQRF